MKNLLVIDVGNSNIVLGFYKGEKLAFVRRIKTDRGKSGLEYAGAVDFILKNEGLSSEMVDEIAVSSVVPALKEAMEVLVGDYFRKSAFHVTPHCKKNFTVCMDNPDEIGADLIAGAAGAVEKYGTPCVVVDLGTATTIIAIDSERMVTGGAIAPGLSIFCDALYRHAPHLPRIEMKSPPETMGRNTIHAMQAGMFNGYRHMVVGLVKDAVERLGGGRVIATGGLAPIINAGGKYFDEVDDNLVVDGVRILHKINR